MNHLKLVDSFETSNHLLQNQSSLNLSEPTPDFFKLFKISTVAQLHKQVIVVGCTLYVDQLNYLRTVYFCQNVDLIFQIVEESIVELRLLKNLASKANGLVLLQVCYIHFTELPRSYTLCP